MDFPLKRERTPPQNFRHDFLKLPEFFGKPAVKQE